MRTAPSVNVDNIIPLYPPSAKEFQEQWYKVHDLLPHYKLRATWAGRVDKGQLGFTGLELSVYRFIWVRFLTVNNYTDPRNVDKPECMVRIPRWEIAEAVGCELHHVTKATTNLVAAGVITRRSEPNGRNQTRFSNKALKVLTFQYDDVFYGLPCGYIPFPSLPKVPYVATVPFTKTAARWLSRWLSEHGEEELPIATEKLWKLCLDGIKATEKELSRNAFGRVASKKLDRRHGEYEWFYVAKEVQNG